MAYTVAICGSYLFTCGKTSNMQLSKNSLSLQAIWLEVNCDIDGSTREHTNTHTSDWSGQSWRYLLCATQVLFHVTWRQKFRPRLYVRRLLTRSIWRIGPVIEISLPVGSALVVSPTYEPQHYKTNKMFCAPSKDSDQPGHPPSLITVFAVRTMGSWGPNVSSCGIRLVGCPGWSESSLGAEVILMVWSYRRRLI